MTKVKNPIYIDYYSHENGNCYKIDLPFSAYRQYTLVLCPVSEGLERAKSLAVSAMDEHVRAAVEEPICES